MWPAVTRILPVALAPALGLAGAILLACTGASVSIPDAEISLRREGLLEPSTPPQVLFALKDAGESELLVRAYYGAPPMVPHSVVDLVVTANTNDCLDCHEEGDEDTPALPPSHRVKALFALHTRADAQGGMTTAFAGFGRVETVSGQRYDCRLCHTPQATSATELVPNSFEPADPADAHEDDLEPLKLMGKY